MFLRGNTNKMSLFFYEYDLSLLTVFTVLVSLKNKDARTKIKCNLKTIWGLD